jgi:hypothetical protein
MIAAMNSAETKSEGFGFGRIGPIYPWRRYWARRDGFVDLSDDGFLVDPESERARYSAQKLHTLSELQQYRALALLGEPGIGKSVTLESEYAALQQAGGESGHPLQRHVDLRSFSSDVLLHSRVFGNPDFLAWKAGNSDLVLYLDSLDEALLRIDTVAALIADELPQHPTARISIRITCRTFVWPHEPLETAFARIWGENAVGIFELAPLRRRDVADAAAQRRIDANRFIEEVQNANAVPFAIKPLTLNLLFRLYERNGSLPNRQADLYAQGCLSLCEEHSPNRRGAGRLGQLNSHQRRRLAGRTAAVTMLANRYAVWTGPVDDLPDEDVPLAALATGTETGDFQPLDATDANLREVLDTGLFSSRGANRTGWAHQSYAEFLAADYLVTKRTSFENILKILCHPSGGLIPQLWMVAAWVASRSPELRRLLIAQEPFTLLRGDLFSWTAEDLAALTEALLTAFQEQRAHDFAWGMASDYRKLAHPGLADQLRPFIVDTTRHIIARRASLMIARACSLHELQPELLTVALNAADEPFIRAQAVSALETCGDDASKAQLLPLARDELGPDPNHEIKGRALGLLWPHHLTGGEIFALLTPPDDGFVGAYVMFITRDLPKSLVGDDLIPALEWATEYARSASLTNQYHTKQLADAILVRAWDHTEVPGVLQAFVRYVQAVLHHSHQLFMSVMKHEDADFRDQIRAEVQRRRNFLLYILSGAEPLQPYDGYLFRRTGFLEKSDLEWLLAITPHGSNPVAGLNATSLCALIESVFEWDGVDFETFYDIAVTWEPLHEKYEGLLDGIPLDSADASQMRNQYHQMLELNSHRPPLLDPPPAERVRMDLDRFEAGNIDAWWHLNVDLLLLPTSTHFNDLELRITKMPGWIAADEATRERIVRAARKFLDGGVSLAQTWLGTTSCKRSDLSAYRALLLIYELDHVVYARLDTAVWEKWAAVIIAVPKETGTEEARFHEAVTADALVSAPHEVARTIQQLIRVERRRSRRNPQNPGGSPFFILRTLGEGLIAPALNAVMHHELTNRNNSPPQFESLLYPLLKAGSEPSRKLAMGMLRTLSRAAPNRRPYRIVAAAGLLSTTPREAWPLVWRWIEADPTFGSDLFQQIGRCFGGELPFYSALDDALVGQLYLWLEQSFPAQSDARHQRMGRASWVGPFEQVSLLRDAVLRDLVNRGTEQSVAVLRQIVAQLSDRQWLVYQVLEAEQIMRTKTWTPLTPREVITITDLPSAVLILSAPQLSNVLVRTLRKYETHLHGEQTPVRALWDMQAGDPRRLRPVDEDAVSDQVRLFLKGELVDSGIVVNREVEIGRVPGARLGSRTDIKVEAISRTEGGGAYNVITAVIETKGCWNAELLSAMQTQLVEDYLVRLAASSGIYLVAWFDKAKWDLADSRRARTRDWSRDEAQSQLDAQAAAQPPAFIVRAVVLDCHAP